MKNQNEKPIVMIVDDIPANLSILEEMLHTEGYVVMAFTKGEMAISAALIAPPDLIILDIMMPEQDGFEVCRKLKMNNITNDIPVIFISALDDTSNKVKAFTHGGVDYITKPFQTEEVISRIKTHLDIAALRNQLKENNNNLEELVVRRTKELELANERLLELDKLKNEFLHMISHEIRTPASGILGIGEILMVRLAPKEENLKLCNMFKQSSERLYRLIDDSTMIADLEDIINDNDFSFSLTQIMNDVRESLPSINIVYKGHEDSDVICFQLNYTLLRRAMETIMLLAACFSTNPKSIMIKGTIKEGDLYIHIDLDALSITDKEAQQFFNIESAVRGSSRAQKMGLAPVVAHRILKAFGGGLSLIKREPDSGVLEAVLYKVSCSR